MTESGAAVMDGDDSELLSTIEKMDQAGERARERGERERERVGGGGETPY